MRAHEGEGGAGGGRAYELQSDLAQYCFPSAIREEGQGLAWINSICVLVLALGLAGLKKPVLTALPIAPIEEPMPTIFEPPPQQQVVEQETPPEEPEASFDPTEAPQVVTMVAADPQAAAFAVPVTGPVAFAPVHMAAPPPLNPPKRQPAPPSAPVLFAGAGQGGTPWPNVYPPEAWRNREQGTVWIEFRVETNGTPYEVSVLESSGSALLDKHSADWVRKRWSFPPGERRHHKVPFMYQLK